MGKKFMGLGGTDHFWDRAKAWILDQITSAVAAKIAEVVANAPEDLDTLKEIADWIKTHANDAAAMNTQITENKSNIATNASDISALKTSVAGKADKVHTHSAGDITSGTLPIANGGTGATTAKDAFMSLANGLTQANNPQDAEYMIYKNTGGTNWGLYTLSHFWEYIKGKISSVLGLTATAYGGKASTAETADKTVNDITIGIPYVAESGQYVIPLGNILPPESEEYSSPYNWDITGFFSIVRPAGHAGEHITFAAGHGYSHGFTTYAYLDEDKFTEVGRMRMSIKAFQYNGEWWLGLWINAQWQDYTSKMTVTYSKGLPATPTCILYNSQSGGVANEEIYNSIQDIPSSWWKTRTIYNPTTFTQNITAPVIQATTNFIGNFIGNVSGNSETATNANNAYNAYSGMVHNCYTNPATAAKTVSIPGFTLTYGACIRVLFGNGNSVAYPTLNVNDTGAKEIRCARGRLDTAINNNSDISTKKGSGVYTWDASTVLDLYYDGSYWRVIGDPIVKRSYADGGYWNNITITGINKLGFLF